MDSREDKPFQDLPASLVNELLASSTQAGKQILRGLEELKGRREKLRREILARGLLKKRADLPEVPQPTVAATDGSYVVERLLGLDFLTAAAVAVEGLTPPSELRFWPEPRHRTYVEVAVHHEASSNLLRAYMLGLELELAFEAPHHVVFLDGSITLPLIYWNQALQKLSATGLLLEQKLIESIELFLHIYRLVLRPNRSDRQLVALPKYSTRREFASMLGVNGDDRALLSRVLEAEEYTEPLPFEKASSPWHLGLDRLPKELKSRLETVVKDITLAMNEAHVVYYRPRSWLPALRVELPAAVAQNPQRLATVLSALSTQSIVPAMLEPYPLYLADRMVKALPHTIPAFRQVATQFVAEHYSGDLGEVYFTLHGYRSEGGA